ncbi:DUF1800 domain-containing protein [uncultured Jatrophihabitans sp.]|uniref:DUF1800 domain-containing protein n=1 Tax=uncultured Jatrophihabitans sp. TaxID=1610747 RepID=UPI0035C9DD8B
MSIRIYPTIALAQGNAARTAAAPLVWDPVNHLLSRCAFGPTTASRASLAQTGPDAWYAAQVAAGRRCQGYSGNPAVAAQGPLLSLSPFDLRATLAANGNPYGSDAMDQLSQVTMGLQAWSEAQLYEVLVDFFSNHLNVPNHNGDLWTTRHTHDRDVIRPYVLGSFTDMLLASAKNPAMLLSLNLAQSTKLAVNENYGRELMEMHTVGRIYSENDVKNAAKLLTGRTLDANNHYVYNPDIHGTGKVTVLGFTNANTTAAGGEKAGDALLRYLAGHSATAKHLAQKLCVRLVSDTPSADLVAAVAAAYTASGTQILPMLSTILRSTEFWESRGKKVRRPAENVMATIRLLDITPNDMTKALGTLNWVTYQMGNRPLDWPAPNGYPDDANSWRSSGTILQLWSMHQAMTGAWWAGFPAPSTASLYGGATPTSSGEAISLMTKRLTGMSWSAAHLAALQTYLGEPAGTSMDRSVLRWLAGTLAALILNAPHHAFR